MIMAMKISIPYGAIKRVPTIIKKSEVNIFQFLMVRLKVIGLASVLFFQSAFQFLMVRLKDNLKAIEDWLRI